jgi:hypothetical protein
VAKRRTRRVPGNRGKCAYCGEAPGLEDEHVFPESWYPDTTPADLEKLTVPSCGPCNRRWHKVEDRLLFELSVVIDPDAPEASGIWERQLRALTAEKGRNADDAKHRSRRATKLIQTIKWFVPGVPGTYEVPLPGAAGLTATGTPARAIEHALWAGISEKFIKGLHYAETGRALGKIDVRVEAGGRWMLNVRDPAVRKAFLAVPLNRAVAPAFTYGRVHFAQASAWRFCIWNQIAVFAITEPGVDPASISPDARAVSRR